MSNITTDDLLEEKLLKIWKTENEDLMKTFIVNTLHGNRAHALAFFQRIIQTHQGKIRFKILELLMLDPAKDLINLVVSAIRLEKNTLFAKSLLFLYGNFEFPEALEALMGLEGQIHADLDKSFQKVIGKLRGRFRELFYISEFQSGEKNAKRMAHAAEMMVKEPHPSYLPFLNQMAKTGSLSQRKTAAKVLASVGDALSLDALFEVLPLYLDGRNKSRSLALYLLSEKTYENPKLADVISTLAMLGEWSTEHTEPLEGQLRRGEAGPTLALVKQSLLPDDTLITQDIFRFLGNFLAGGAPPKAELKRIERLFEEHYESLTGQLTEALAAIGLIGYRENVAQLLERVEALISSQAKDGQELLAAFLGGYQTEGSRQRLLDLLTLDQDPALTQKVLTALEHYQFDSVHPAILRIASSPSEGLLRQGCLNLIARANLLSTVLDTLLKSESAIVLVDTIQTIAAYEVKEGLPHFYHLLTTDINPRLQESIISALESFPSEETGLAVRPFLSLPHTYLIRYAALKTLTLSGGPQRISMIIQTLQDYPEKSKPEMLASFLKLVSSHWQPELLEHHGFWKELLNEERYQNLRSQTMDLIDKVNWEDAASEAWVDLLSKSAESETVKRSSQENKTLRITALRIRSLLEKRPAPPAPERKLTLGGLLDKLTDANLHQKVRTVHLLLLHFKPEWYNEGDSDSERLVEFLTGVFTSDMGLPELTKMSLSLAARIKHPSLTETAVRALPNLPPELAEFGRSLFSDAATQDNTVGHPVQSILVLDDTALIAKSLQRFLSKSGFEVAAATHCEEALKLLQSQSFDLLIIDYLMPELNGFQFLAEARQREIAPPFVVMVTSSRDHDVVRTAAQMRLNGLLLKPFPIPDLLEKIQHMRVTSPPQPKNPSED